MITVRIPKWPKNYPNVHIRTVFVIANDVDMTNIIDTITLDINKDDNIENAKSNHIVPVGKVYYATFIRYFVSEDEVDSDDPLVMDSGVVGPFPIYPSNNLDNENIKPDSIIEFPSIYVNDDINDSEITTLTITTSKPRLSGPGHHKYTHWLITDENDAVIYRDLYSENKTELVIDKDNIPFSGISEIKIMASHVNSYKHESPFGILKLSVE